MIRTSLAVVIAILAFGLVAHALDPVVVKHLVQMGTECVDIGDSCATCTADDGNDVFVRCEGSASPSTFCYSYADDQCSDQQETGYVGPRWAPCDLVPQCFASIAFDPEILFEARLTGNGTFFFHRAENMNGAAIITSTSGSARGYLPNIGFATESEFVRYVGVDQLAGTAVTTAGFCDIGDWCLAGETLEYRVTVVTNTTATSPEGGGFHSPTGVLVGLYSDIPMTMHGTSDQQLFFHQESVAIELEALQTLEIAMPCGDVFYGDENPGKHRCLLNNFSMSIRQASLTYDVTMDGGDPQAAHISCSLETNPSISNVPIFDCDDRLLTYYL